MTNNSREQFDAPTQSDMDEKYPELPAGTIMPGLDVPISEDRPWEAKHPDDITEGDVHRIPPHGIEKILKSLSRDTRDSE